MDGGLSFNFAARKFFERDFCGCLASYGVSDGDENSSQKKHLPGEILLKKSDFGMKNEITFLSEWGDVST